MRVPLPVPQHARAEALAREGLFEVLVDRGALAFVADAVEHQRQVWALQYGESELAPQVGAGILVDGDVVDVGQ